MVWIIVSFAAGLLVGGIFGAIINRKKPIGSLRLDQSDPQDGPYLFLELNDGNSLNIIKRSKYVTLEVNVKNFISHE